jgi:hypothetical protein
MKLTSPCSIAHIPNALPIGKIFGNEERNPKRRERKKNPIIRVIIVSPIATPNSNELTITLFMCEKTTLNPAGSEIIELKPFLSK